MKQISFLGTANYSHTTFYLEDIEYGTRFFPAALAHFLRPESVLVCATPTVQNHHNLTSLGQELQALGIAWQTIPIPEGHSESDLWAIFEAITTAVEEDERVTFDVTHSFRSLPILAFLAVAYLKAARNVQVERVLYGAFEARSEASNRSPVFDLTPFVSLLDWLTATTRFIETGDGHALAQLLRGGMPSGPQMGRDLEARSLGRNLRSAAEAIESVSLALRVARPLETMQSAAQLEATLSQSMPGILQSAKPFGVLAEQVIQEYGQFALENPGEEQALVIGLWRQLEMINWYRTRRHVVQAATLGREWLVSVLAYKFKAPMFDYENGRKQVEYALSNAVEKRKPDPHLKGPSLYDRSLEALPQADQICKMWSKMAKLRNDIAHVGMRVSPDPASLLKQKMESLYNDMEELAQALLPQEESANQP